MGRLLICDWCGNKMFTFYKDEMYKITVKQLTHAYDGYNPWVKKQRIDICMDCRNEIVKKSENNRLATPEEGKHE